MEEQGAVVSTPFVSSKMDSDQSDDREHVVRRTVHLPQSKHKRVTIVIFKSDQDAERPISPCKAVFTMSTLTAASFMEGSLPCLHDNNPPILLTISSIILRSQ